MKSSTPDSEKYRGLFTGPLCMHAVSYLALLERRGYKRPTVHPDALLIADLDQWMSKERQVVSKLTENVLERFMRYHMRERHSRRRAKWAALGRLLAMLREMGVSAPATPTPSTPAQRWVDEFGRHLRLERGFALTTIAGYGGVIRSFLGALFKSDLIALGRLSPSTIVDFVRQHVRGHSRVQAQYVTTALRSFFRFLRQRGAITEDLASAVPHVASWALAGLPKHLAPGAVHRVLTHQDRTTACGRRDYAILLLLARLGLRSCEVADLRLEDIEWEHGRFNVRSRKGGRSVLLPLPYEVGQAIARYLKDGRPRCTCRQVFVRNQAPLTGMTRITIGHVARKALIRSGIKGVCLGAHTFRHTLATDLLRQGASLDEIGRILRHKDASTTAIYAKVDIGALRSLAMRWPGGAR
jgi:site-specific recombinase XerD